MDELVRISTPAPSSSDSFPGQGLLTAVYVILLFAHFTAFAYYEDDFEGWLHSVLDNDFLANILWFVSGIVGSGLLAALEILLAEKLWKMIKPK